MKPRLLTSSAQLAGSSTANHMTQVFLVDLALHPKVQRRPCLRADWPRVPDAVYLLIWQVKTTNSE